MLQVEILRRYKSLSKVNDFDFTDVLSKIVTNEIDNDINTNELERNLIFNLELKVKK